MPIPDKTERAAALAFMKTGPYCLALIAGLATMEETTIDRASWVLVTFAFSTLAGGSSACSMTTRTSGGLSVDMPVAKLAGRCRLAARCCCFLLLLDTV